MGPSSIRATWIFFDSMTLGKIKWISVVFLPLFREKSNIKISNDRSKNVHEDVFHRSSCFNRTSNDTKSKKWNQPQFSLGINIVNFLYFVSQCLCMVVRNIYFRNEREKIYSHIYNNIVLLTILQWNPVFHTALNQAIE